MREGEGGKLERKAPAPLGASTSTMMLLGTALVEEMPSAAEGRRAPLGGDGTRRTSLRVGPPMAVLAAWTAAPTHNVGCGSSFPSSEGEGGVAASAVPLAVESAGCPPSPRNTAPLELAPPPPSPNQTLRGNCPLPSPTSLATDARMLEGDMPSVSPSRLLLRRESVARMQGDTSFIAERCGEPVRRWGERAGCAADE
eukprot:scaffold53827_cov28-Tisochrysis_lutea.AAC.1